jgi:hypothetical protein
MDMDQKIVKQEEQGKESIKPVYLRIGRGQGAQAIVLPPFMVKLISDALSSATLKGDMATGGGTTGRTQKGDEQAAAIFELLGLLKDKAD